MAAGPVSAVIVNHDGERYVAGILRALEAQTDPPAEIVLVDDASSDGGIALARRLRPDIRVLSTPANLGPGGARNLGIAAAHNDLVVCLDNDALPDPGCFRELARVLALHPEAAAIQARIVDAGHPDVVRADGADVHFTGLMSLVNGGVPLSSAPRDPARVGSIMTTAFLVRRSALPPGPPFDDAYFFHFEDLDFGARLSLAGRTIMNAPSALVLHREGTEGLSFRGQSYPLRRAYLSIRNRWYFMAKTLRLRTLLALLPLLLLYEIAALAFVLVRGWADAEVAAVRWNIAHLGATMEARRTLARRRVVPDRDILRGGPTPLHPRLFRSPAGRRVAAVLDGALSALWRILRPLI